MHEEKEAVDDAAAAIAAPKSELEQQEVFRLKDCGHEFHAECLVSWTVLRKINCPICRTVYYHEESEKPTDVEAQADQAGPVTTDTTTAATSPSNNVLNWHYFWTGRSARRGHPESQVQSS